MPLSLVGTLAVMYLLGYSLNNLTLMALTISTGFVVDDAIVMIENIVRYIEEGEKPLEAALKGAEQIGFTIVSLTISLIAVLIPLLFMGDIVGRLFREFAITLSVTILVSAVVSLTLTPMMCSKLLQREISGPAGTVLSSIGTRVSEASSTFMARLCAGFCKYRVVTLLVAAATLVLTVWLYIIVPKGFFPVQDTGVIQGISEASADYFISRDGPKAAGSRASHSQGSRGRESFLVYRSRRHKHNAEQRAHSDQSQAAGRARRDCHGGHAPACSRSWRKVDGITLYMQPVQDLTVEDRVSRTQYQYSLEDPNADELNTWTTRFVDKLKTLPQLQDVATDQQTRGSQTTLVIDRVTASRLGITPQ